MSGENPQSPISAYAETAQASAEAKKEGKSHRESVPANSSVASSRRDLPHGGVDPPGRLKEKVTQSA